MLIFKKFLYQATRGAAVLSEPLLAMLLPLLQTPLPLVSLAAYTK